MSDADVERKARIIAGVLGGLGILFYLVIALGIVGTWGDPDLIDALVVWISGSELECIRE